MNTLWTLEIWELGPLSTNCVLAAEKASGHAVVIDPPDVGHDIARMVREGGWTLDRILITHGHFDHIGGAAALHKETGAGVWIHKADAPMLDASVLSFMSCNSDPICEIEPAGFLDEGMVIPVGALSLRVVHLPGHSPGSVGFVGDGFAIVGDTLFARGVGRTDLPGGSSSQLLTAIREKLFTLDDDTQIYPGHGPSTTIGDERRRNPYLT